MSKTNLMSLIGLLSFVGMLAAFVLGVIRLIKGYPLSGGACFLAGLVFLNSFARIQDTLIPPRDR